MTLNRTNHRIRPKFPDGTDRKAIYEFYRKNADSLIAMHYAVGLDHRLYDFTYNEIMDVKVDRIIEEVPEGSLGVVGVCAIGSDGKAFAVGIGYRSYNFEHISYIASGQNHTVGLCSDGTVVAVCHNSTAHKIKEACNVQRWSNIVQIACGDNHTVGLRADGTVTADGDDDCCRTQNWDDIVSITCGSSHTFGLRADGTVLVSGNKYVFNVNLQDWKNITSIAFGGDYIVGLCADGTVVAKGNNKDGQCNVKDWRDIIALSCAETYTVGLRADGTVMATGGGYKGQCNVKDFHDIVAIKATSKRTIGIRKDGYVMYTDWYMVEKPHLLGIYYSKDIIRTVTTSSIKLF